MKVKEIIAKLQQCDSDLDVILFFNAGDDVFYEEAAGVGEAFLDPAGPFCYRTLDEVKEDYGEDEDISDLEKVVAIGA